MHGIREGSGFANASISLIWSALACLPFPLVACPARGLVKWFTSLSQLDDIIGEALCPSQARPIRWLMSDGAKEQEPQDPVACECWFYRCSLEGMTDSVALAGLMSLRLIPMGLWQRVVLSLRRLKYSVTKGKYLTSLELSPAGRKDELFLLPMDPHFRSCCLKKWPEKDTVPLILHGSFSFTAKLQSTAQMYTYIRLASNAVFLG